MKFHCKILCCRILRSFIVVCFVFCLLFPGCRKDKEVSAVSNDYLLKCGSILISVNGFSEELELEKSAYPYDLNYHTEEYKNLVLDLAAQLSQELVLRAAAAEDGISVSAKDIDDAEKEVRKDFPGDSFQKMLLENAVSYSVWKKRLGIRLLINRFIEKKLKDKIEITPEDIENYYQLHKQSDEFKKKYGVLQNQDAGIQRDGTQKTNMEGKQFLVHLRSQKAEKEYPAWINALNKKFPVEINKEKLNFFLQLKE